MNRYYIIGSGGFAKEVLFLAKSVLDSDNQFSGFIEQNPNQKTIVCMNEVHPILDENLFLKEILPSDEVHVYIGIGNPKVIAKIHKKFEEYNFPNLIHSNFIGNMTSIQMGIGNIITAGCVFTVDIKIGNLNIFNLNTTVGHDTEIGNYNIFNPGCNVSGNVKIESENLFGTNSTILQGVKFGSKNTLGAASLGNKEVLDNTVMVGVPAKKLER